MASRPRDTEFSSTRRGEIRDGVEGGDGLDRAISRAYLRPREGARARPAARCRKSRESAISPAHPHATRASFLIQGAGAVRRTKKHRPP